MTRAEVLVSLPTPKPLNVAAINACSRPMPEVKQLAYEPPEWREPAPSYLDRLDQIDALSRDIGEGHPAGIGIRRIVDELREYDWDE
jgi:hypothetical protein